MFAGQFAGESLKEIFLKHYMTFTANKQQPQNNLLKLRLEWIQYSEYNYVRVSYRGIMLYTARGPQ